MQRDKSARRPAGQLRGQAIRQSLQDLSGTDIGFQRHPRQLHPRILVGAAGSQACLLRLRAGRGIASGIIPSGDREQRHPVAHAKRALVAEQPRRNGQPVERTRHNLKRAQAAFRRPLAKRSVHGEELQKVARRHGFGHRIVKGRAFRRKPIRPVRF